MVQSKYLAMAAALLAADLAAAFNPNQRASAPRSTRARTYRSRIALSGGRSNRDLEEKASRRAAEKAAGKGGGEMAAGAVIGGLVFGPFGALFGAQMGASMGARRAFDSEKEKEMEKMGISKDMMAMAEEVGTALERATDGLKATKDSLETQQAFARRVDAQVEEVYARAKAAVEAGEEERAKDLLFERTGLQEKLKKALIACSEEKKRVQKMKANVLTMEERAMEVDSLLRRSVGSTAFRDMGSSQLSLSSEDPLLQKFRDAGID